MKRKLRSLLAVITALVLTLGMSVCAFAADDIVLDGDEAGGSSFVKEFSAKGAEYKYLGYVTTKEATSEYRYLQITYTGDISCLRIEFNREDDSNEGPYWFNPDGQTLYFKTADGSAIPLTATSKTTVKLDLKAIGIDIGEFRGLHLHYLDPNMQEGSFTVSDARLIADTSSSGSTSTQGSSGTSTGTSTEDGTTVNNSISVSGGTEGTAGGSTDAPTTGSATWPIVIAIAGIGVAVVAFMSSKKFKEEQ